MPDDVPAHKRPRPRLRRFAFVPAIALALHAAPSSADPHFLAEAERLLDRFTSGPAASEGSPTER